MQKNVVYASPYYDELSLLNQDDRLKILDAELNSYSKNTLKSYECCKHFLNYSPDLPVVSSKLKLFLLNEAEKGKSYLVLEKIITSLNFVCDFLHYDIICSKKLCRLKRHLKKVAKPKKSLRKGFQYKQLLNLWKSVHFFGFKNLTFVEIRIFVMIIIMYFTASRFNCMSNVKLSNVTYDNEFIKIVVPVSKTDQSGEGQIVYVPHTQFYDPHKMLCNYIRILNAADDSFLFPSLKYDKCKKSWNVEFNQQIKYGAAYNSFKTFLKKFGVDFTFYGLHSMRIGGVTDMFEKKMPSKVIDQYGRWKSSHTKFVYKKHDEDFYKSHLKIFVNSL